MPGDKSVIEISDDKRVEEPPTTLVNEKVAKEDIEALAQAPDWLPDGWIMEVYCEEDGTIRRYYTSPVSDCTFTTDKEVLDYLFSGKDERILESKEEERAAADSTLHKTHQWLPKGWVMEIRAGGDIYIYIYMDLFYVHSQTGVRLVSKEDVLLYVNDSRISECDTKGQCDISSDDNILAKVELNPKELPDGWVKEEVFRKTKERVRGDLNCTDPTTGYTFRSLKSALSYLQTGKVPDRATIPKRSVHDLYSFDKSADLVIIIIRWFGSFDDGGRHHRVILRTGGDSLGRHHRRFILFDFKISSFFFMHMIVRISLGLSLMDLYYRLDPASE
ncbi:hypothetical protein PVAP13_9NG501900 [Panicum virgatum]|uniref:MBD domain-containing protein n=1 Tax=Panicum virgatum TaxID=38727 RepID=A0A8T0MY48_PANVG|nr:hypothetical protein PVAP13_9NG501900 [Panicum virgatum]